MVTMGRMQIVFSFITISNKIFFSSSENCNHSQVLEKKWLIQKILAYGKHAPKLNRINYSEYNRVLMVLNDLFKVCRRITTLNQLQKQITKISSGSNSIFMNIQTMVHVL